MKMSWMGNSDERERSTRDCGRRGRLRKLTGPISTRVVRSRTFSIGDLLGSTGGGLTRVVRGILAAEGRVQVAVDDERLSIQMTT